MMKTNTGQAVLAVECIINLVDTIMKVRKLPHSKPKTSGGWVLED